MDKREKEREKEREKSRKEAHSLRGSGVSRVVKGAILRYADGTTETGLLQVIIHIRTTTKALGDLLHVLEKFSLRATAPVARGQVQTIEDVKLLLALRKLVAGTAQQDEALEIQAPETWILYGSPESVADGVSFLDSSYRRGVCTLVGWEYVENRHIPATARGAGGGEGWKQARLPLPKQEHEDEGKGMDRHERLTGKRFVAGPKNNGKGCRTTNREDDEVIA